MIGSCFGIHDRQTTSSNVLLLFLMRLDLISRSLRIIQGYQSVLHDVQCYLFQRYKMASASFLDLSVEVRLIIYAYLFSGFALRLDHHDNVRAHGDSEVDFVNAIC